MRANHKYYVRISVVLPARGFDSFFEALDFAEYWNADLLIREEDKLVPICNP